MKSQIGKYQIVGKLGEGGMAAVYLARDPMLERDVALKIIPQGPESGERQIRRFLNEAKVAASLMHPNVVTVYELGEEDGLPFIAMEYLPGRDLDEAIREGRLPSLRERLEVARQIALGLDHAHSRAIIHRDIKPSNIRLLESGAVKLMDFGIAKLASEHLTKTGQAVGTPSYMAPEQILGQLATPSADLYSFGVVLYEMLTGVVPFTGKNIQTLISAIVGAEPPPFPAALGVPPGLQSLVLRCLAKSPAQRPESAAALVAELDALAPLLLSDPGAGSAPRGAASVPTPAAAMVQPRAVGLNQFTGTDQVHTPLAVPVDRVAELAAAARDSQRTPSALSVSRPVAATASGSSPIFLVGLILLGIIAAVVLVVLL